MIDGAQNAVRVHSHVTPRRRPANARATVHREALDTIVRPARHETELAVRIAPTSAPPRDPALVLIEDRLVRLGDDALVFLAEPQRLAIVPDGPADRGALPSLEVAADDDHRAVDARA